MKIAMDVNCQKGHIYFWLYHPYRAFSLIVTTIKRIIDHFYESKTPTPSNFQSNLRRLDDQLLRGFRCRILTMHRFQKSTNLFRSRTNLSVFLSLPQLVDTYIIFCVQIVIKKKDKQKDAKENIEKRLK